MPHKNERVELEMKSCSTARWRATSNGKLTNERIKALVAELKQKLREIDE